MKCMLPVIFLLSLSTFSQDYSGYYQLINRAEEEFVTHRDARCFETYDEAFTHYSPYLKDPYIAAQLALYLQDTTRFYQYLGLCFRHGMPLTAIAASDLIRKARKGNVALRIQQLYADQFRPKQIDQDLLNTICLQCYQSDSIKMKEGVNTAFYASENATRRFILDSMLMQGKFPNERMLGITTDAMWQDFYIANRRTSVYEQSNPFGTADNSHKEDFELRLKCPYNIILHSNCFYTEHKEYFRTAMLNGYIHPKEIGILEETAILWNWNTENEEERCERLPFKACYNIFGYNPMRDAAQQTFTDTPDGLLQVEANRAAIFMQKYSVDVQKKEWEKKTDLRFFFDFVDR